MRFEPRALDLTLPVACYLTPHCRFRRTRRTPLGLRTPRAIIALAESELRRLIVTASAREEHTFSGVQSIINCMPDAELMGKKLRQKGNSLHLVLSQLSDRRRLCERSL